MYKGYTKLSTFTVDAVAAAFKKVGSQRIAHIYNTDSEDFFAWLNNNYYDVVAEIGITGEYSINWDPYGREINGVITTYGNGITVSGSVVSYGDEAEAVTIELWQEGIGEASYSITVSGNDASYSIDEVDAGTYTVKVMKKNHVSREYTITVDESDVTQDVNICLLGNVTGDGRVNAIDINRLFAHTNASGMLTDEYTL